MGQGNVGYGPVPTIQYAGYFLLTSLMNKGSGYMENLSLAKMLSGANAFEISDIERMNIGAYQPGV